MEIRGAKEAEVEAIVPLMLAYCDFYEVPHPDEAGLAQMARALIAAPDGEGFLLVGSGLADGLIGAAAELARAHGAAAMTWMTQPSNERAQAVYKRVGGSSEELLEYELEL